MKNKPTRHKESNTFKFKPFSERIADIDVDVFHRVSHRNEEESAEVETHFHQTLQKWSVLNLTENYTNLKKEVRGIVTLPQLLNSKEQVITVLLKYLSLKDTLCLQPILELVVAAARDLQKEFYEYFPEFLTVIIDLLHTNDAEQLESAFTALAYLFKFLWRYLIKNIDTVFDLLIPLLAESKPTYVNNFAAESFSFVVRKIKDKDAFLKLLLDVLAKRSDGVSGCGKLLFEVIQGTPGKFHSCAEQMLMLYMGNLENKSIDRQLLYQVLQQIISCFLNSILPQNSEIFWNVTLQLMDRFMESYKTSDRGDIFESSTVECNNELFLLQNLLLEVMNYRDGRMLVNPDPLINQLVKTLDFFEKNKSNEQGDKIIIGGSAKLSGFVLLAKNVKLTQESSNKLVHKILSISNSDILHSVVEQLIPYSSFETLVLPYFINYSFQTCLNNDIFRIFAKIIITKSSPCLNGINLKAWMKYSLNIRNIPNDSLNYLGNELEILNENSITKAALQILIILPHLNPLPKKCEEILLKVTASIYQKLIDLDNPISGKELNTLSFTFLLAIESLVHILKPDEFYDYITRHDINLLKLINNYSVMRSILGVVDLCLTHIATSESKDNFINVKMFDSINQKLAPLLGSPYHKDRFIVAHIYSIFSDLAEFVMLNDAGRKNLLEVPYLAELEPATVHTYKERLLQLQGLAFQSHGLSNLDSQYFNFPIYYLLGNLYINFSLLWDPTIQLISSYAHKQCGLFWPIFLSKLEYVKTPEDAGVRSTSIIDCDVTSLLLGKVYDNDDNPDYNNYNLLLWKCMGSFIDFCEMKNRDLTGLFIDFVETNFFKSNSEDAKSCSIKKHDGDNGSIVQVTQVEDDDNSDGEKTVQNNFELNKLLFDNKHKIKLLLAQLEIFSKMRNPRTLYRETNMYKIYLELLSSKNTEIQKSALNCILSYKHKYLLPYKDHLYNLIDEKRLKNELALFKIDKESNMIQDDHRDGLLPIVMRIAYAKMIMKTGMRTGGKAGGLVRRTIVLRFLAGTQED